MDILKFRKLILEFSRYVIVGGIAFIADISTLYIFKEYLLEGVPFDLYLATAVGFMAGLTVNYLLCIKFVFLSAKRTEAGKGNRDKILFAVIGIIGLAINELGMSIGAGFYEINYLFVKVVVAGIVLLWNYFARKFMIFDIVREGN